MGVKGYKAARKLTPSIHVSHKHRLGW